MSNSEVEKSEVGVRFDKGKLRYDLLPPDGIEELVRVFTVGAAKYADRNWEKGMDWGRVLGSLDRHKAAFLKGEKIDPETGCHHLGHLVWNALALLTYDLRGIGKDDITLKKPAQLEFIFK